MQSEEGVVVELSRVRHAMWGAMSATLDITDLHPLPVLNTHIFAHYIPLPSSSSDNPPPFNLAHALGPGVGLPSSATRPSLAMTEWRLFRPSIANFSSSNPSKPSSTTASKSTLTIRLHADISLALATPTGCTRLPASEVVHLALGRGAKRRTHRIEHGPPQRDPHALHRRRGGEEDGAGPGEERKG
ncbi:hypothetical protein B0H19DRAFT_1252329 [Mycena capillaripes]|nr:hypothetical protein B0H19DRAFT_1252329 [Mycena capillaripes]